MRLSLGHLTGLTGVFRTQRDDWVTRFRPCAGGAFKSNRMHMSETNHRASFFLHIQIGPVNLAARSEKTLPSLSCSVKEQREEAILLSLCLYISD